MKPKLQIEGINGYIIIEDVTETPVSNDLLESLIWDYTRKLGYPLDQMELIDHHVEDNKLWIEFNGNLDYEILVGGEQS